MSNKMYMCGFGRRCDVDPMGQMYPEEFLSMLNSFSLVHSNRYSGVESWYHDTSPVTESVHILLEAPGDLEHPMELVIQFLVWGLLR